MMGKGLVPTSVSPSCKVMLRGAAHGLGSLIIFFFHGGIPQIFRAISCTFGRMGSLRY